jgi:hypothetical protein
VREFTKSMLRFSWAMSLFGARQAAGLLSPSEGGAEAFDTVAKAAEKELGGGLRPLYQAGERIQSGVVDAMFGAFGSGSGTGSCGCGRGETEARQSERGAGGGGVVTSTASPTGWRADEERARATDAHAGSDASVNLRLTSTTQGPFWPPAEVMDADGNFVVVGGFILTEVSPGKVVPLPNERGVIVSKDTVPPLKDGKEDFSNPLGAPYQIVRELDLGPGGADWSLRPHSLSAGPFKGDFGGGRPRVPAAGQSVYNLNANPLWTREYFPADSDSPEYTRPSYPLDQVPVTRLNDIPENISVGVRVGRQRAGGGGVSGAQADFRRRHPITLREYLRGRGWVQITPLPLGGSQSVFTGARFDFTFDELPPHSVYGLWALHAATLSPPNAPNFLLPVPLGIPNVLVTDERGSASASFELSNPFPDPSRDAAGNRLVAVAVIYHSDFQNWGASLSTVATGTNAHTVMSVNFSALTGLVTRGQTG